MEQENKGTSCLIQSNDYRQLSSLLVVFLHSPSPQIQLRLSKFSPPLYLQLILNPSQPKQVRQACCASFKSQIMDRGSFQTHAQSILNDFESIHFTTDSKTLTDIQGSFEMLTEKLFEMYLDDQKKLNAFTSIMQRISNNTNINNSLSNLRGMRLANLLIRAMDTTTLNNQICIGELICYLKQLYYPKNLTQDPQCINGRGSQLLLFFMTQSVSEGPFSALLDVQIQVVKLIKQIIQRLQLQQVEDSDSVPALYIQNSNEINNLFQGILTVSPDGRIYCGNKKINQFKAIIMQVYIEQFLYHASQPFLIFCLNTLARCDARYLYDDIDILISGVLQLLQRSTSHAAYAEYYYSNTQIMIIKLFQLVAAGQAQLHSSQSDPQRFIEIADDFCKNQQSDSVKVRAGSLIYNLCLTIDGNLTFVTNMAMIPLYALEKQLSEQLTPETPIREFCKENAKGMQVLLELWSGRAEGLTQVAILVLSCLSDLIIKRNQFNYIVREHLNAMTIMFNQRQKILTIIPAQIISRYIQMYSFYSFPNCLDAFLPLYPIKSLFSQAIINALETIMQFHDKKSQPMRNYVSLISTKILLLSERLTPLLQQTIVSRPELILCIKQKLVQKLVNWLLDYYQRQNIFGCNKISNLLCKVIEQYPKFMLQTSNELDYNFDLQALNTYLLPLYRQLLSKESQGSIHTAQECIIDIAVQHIECLGINITQDLLHKFVQMGIAVVQHNDCVLNKCLELFSRTLSMPGMQRNKERIQYAKIRKIQVDVGHHLLAKVSQWLLRVTDRDTDRWQMLYLLQIILVTLRQQQPQLSSLNFASLLNIYSNTQCDIVKLKVFSIWMLMMQIVRDQQCQASQCLKKFNIPQRLPPYDRSNFMIYLMGTLTAYSDSQLRVCLLRALIRLFYPTQSDKKYLKNYQEALHCQSSTSQAEIDAFQTVQTILHPLNAMGSDTYAQFRAMYHKLADWQQMRKYMQVEEETAVREILGHQMVGTKARKIYHVKK